jgi:hypothetical protein
MPATMTYSLLAHGSTKKASVASSGNLNEVPDGIDYVDTTLLIAILLVYLPSIKPTAILVLAFDKKTRTEHRGGVAIASCPSIVNAPKELISTSPFDLIGM